MDYHNNYSDRNWGQTLDYGWDALIILTICRETKTLGFQWSNTEYDQSKFLTDFIMYYDKLVGYI